MVTTYTHTHTQKPGTDNLKKNRGNSGKGMEYHQTKKEKHTHTKGNNGALAKWLTWLECRPMNQKVVVLMGTPL